MNKKNLAVVMLLTLPILVGCKKSSTTTPLSFTAPDDWQIQRKDSIVTMEFRNVPTDPIEVGYFSQAGIKLHVKYTEGDEVDYPFDESFFPLEIVSTLKTAGAKAYDINFKENHLALNFRQKKTASPRTIKATFLDHAGAELTHSFVGYLEDATYTGSDVELRLDEQTGRGRDIRRSNISCIKSLRILVDSSIIEYYINDGEQVFTTRYFKKEKGTILSFDVKNADITVFPLKRMKVEY